MKRRNFLKTLSLGGVMAASEIDSLKITSRAISKNYKAEVVIYGGTCAAIMAAVAVKKLGKTALIISPDKHLGGLSSSGLGFTDTGNKSVIGGLARDFYHRLYLHYQESNSWIWQDKKDYGNTGQGTPAIDGENRTMWIFEPHAAEGVFEDLVKENNLRVLRDEWLDRGGGVEIKKGKIKAIKTLSGKKIEGKIFIDATYEGDLMASAGVGYFVGRESNSVYDEDWNGVETGVFQHAHYFKNKIDPYRIEGESSSGLLPRISSLPPGKKGEGDKRIQAYCFRMCLTDHPENRIPFSEPEGYDPGEYELLGRIFQSGWNELFHKFDAIPNRKTDTNNHGPFSTDNIGMNYDYPEGSYETRQQIYFEHEKYQKGLMYFMATDKRVPKELQTKLNTYGLAADEFKDNNNWPYQLYIRESRRMISDYVMTEHDVLGKIAVPSPVGMGSYTLDSHNVQRYVTEEGYVQNEGDIGVQVPKPYQISYKTMIPKSEEVKNLLVPICGSFSHTAFGSVRMEPVFMILGESAGTAAALAIEDHVSVQSVNYNALKEQLVEQNQILSQEK